MVEVSPLLLLSGVGMISVGLLAMIWWAPRTRFRLFMYGGLLWVAAIAVKMLMDLAVTPSFSVWLSGAISQPFIVALALGAYVGLRTGLLECGFPYLAAKTKLRGSVWREFIALGLGFGAFEAILLGAQSLLNVASFMYDPTIIDELPVQMREAVARQFSYGVWVVPLPVLERAFTLVAHVFATVLAAYAARWAKSSLLGASILYKTALDGAIPVFDYLTPGKELIELYLFESYLGALALVGALSLAWFKRWRVDRMESGHPP